jgi:hypothetical protein
MPSGSLFDFWICLFGQNKIQAFFVLGVKILDGEFPPRSKITNVFNFY